MLATRTIEQIDQSLHSERELRRRIQAEIDSTTVRLGVLRRTYVDAGRRITDLLDERNAVTHQCPDTPAELENPGTPA